MHPSIWFRLLSSAYIRCHLMGIRMIHLTLLILYTKYNLILEELFCSFCNFSRNKNAFNWDSCCDEGVHFLLKSYLDTKISFLIRVVLGSQYTLTPLRCPFSHKYQMVLVQLLSPLHKSPDNFTPQKGSEKIDREIAMKRENKIKHIVVN